MGRVAGSYGVRGWIRVVAPQQALGGCRKWSIGGTEYPVEEVKQHSGTLLAKLAGLESREAALKLKGSTVYVRRETLPEPEAGHYYLADLVGLEVVNEQGVVLGVVKRCLQRRAGRDGSGGRQDAAAAVDCVGSAGGGSGRKADRG